MAYFFKDFGKATADLFNDDFSYKRKLKIKLPTPNGVTWTQDMELSNKGVMGKLSAKYKHVSGISLDKLEFKTDGRVLGEASLEVDPHLKLWVSAEDGRQDSGKPIKSHGKLGFEYVKPGAFTVESDVDVVNGPTVHGAAVVNVKGLLAGVEATYNTQLDEKDQKPEFLDYNFGVGLEGKGWETSLRSFNKVSSLQFALFNKVKPSVTVGVTLDYQFDKNTQGMTIGGAFKPDNTTRVSAKVSSSALVSVAYSQQLTPFSTLLIASEVDAKDWASDSHKFGIGLTLQG